MKRTIIAMSILLATSVQAGINKDTGEICQGSDCSGDGDIPTVPVGTVNNRIDNVVNNSNTMSNTVRLQNENTISADQRNSNSQGQRQSQTAMGGNSNASGGTSTVTNNIDYSSQGDYSSTYDEYTPSAVAPPVYTTAPCYVGISAGVGIPGFSGSVGGAIYDKECEVRETVRLGLSSGNPETTALANEVLQARLKAYSVDDGSAVHANGSGVSGNNQGGKRQDDVPDNGGLDNMRNLGLY